MQQNKLEHLKKSVNTLRKDILLQIYSAQSGHPGGSLSCADIITFLYQHEMNIDPANPLMPERDRFVLSKGHASSALYGALAQRGYFPRAELETFRKSHSRLQGHPDRKKLPGVDVTTGSLGQGASAACGIALAGKIDHAGYRVYALLGDGELEEGQIWEAAMFAAHNKLSNMCWIVDCNGLQIDGSVEEISGLGMLDKKFESFGFAVQSLDGHDFEALERGFEAARNEIERPTVILARTVIGKGVSFMEHEVGWHGSAPNEEQYTEAIKELGE